jgi:hypothetical protein
MAAITFHANILANAGNPNAGASGINHAAGSGLGFYGNGYGISVPVGQYQSTTWVTNSNGTANDSFQLHNSKYMSISGVSINGSNAIVNSGIPNYLAPLNIRFTHDTAVRTQNCRLRIFDRNNINTQASGVTTQVYEVRHPSSNQATRGLAHRGAANHSWFEFEEPDVMPDLTFTASPGTSGLNTTAGDTGLDATIFDGADHQSTRHDWYCALSSTPHSIGSKLYGLYFTLEYL